MTTSDYLTSLQNDKTNLVTKLSEKGVEVTGDETFTELVPKIDEIQSGGDASEYFSDNYAPDEYNNYSVKSILKSIPAAHFSQTRAQSIFSNCVNAETIDLSLFDTSNTTDMNNMFSNCRKLKKIDGINNIDTSKVKDMNHIFSNCFMLQNLDLTEWDTSSVTNMSHMFSECRSFQQLNLSGFNVSNVVNMSNMFYNNYNLTNLDISFQDTSNLKYIGSMFYGCTKLEKIDLSSFNINVKSENNIFNNCTSLRELILPQNTNTESLQSWFYKCESIENWSFLQNINTENVTSMYYTFHSTFVKPISENNILDISTWNMGKVNNIYDMFQNTIYLRQLIFGYDLGKGFTTQRNNNNMYTLDLIKASLLTHDSLMSVINNLYDLNLTYDVANGGILYTQQLKIGSANIAKLTPEEIAIATNKGWTVS